MSVDAFGLSPKVAGTIRKILATFPAVEKAVIYGSRAKGTHKPGSDIDLTLFGDRLTSDIRSRIAARLDDSPIPHTIDLSLYAELNHAKLREHIDRVGVVFYERGRAGEDQAVPELVERGAAMKKGWKIEPLGELCDILDSQRKPITKRDRTAGKYPYYGATGIVDYVNDFIFDEQLVLVGEDGAKWASGESTAFRVEGKCWVNNHAHVLRPHRKTVVDNWLIYFLNHSDLSEFVSGLTVPKRNQGNLREIPIPVPPLAEQQRIVGLLDEAFEGIATAKANAEKNLQNARALFESYLQSVFTQKGEGWVEKRFDEICVLQRGFDLPKHSRNPGKYPLVSSNGITDRIDLWKIHGPGVVTGRSGTIGNLHFVDEDFWPLNTALYIKEFHGNYERFVYYFLKQFDLGKFSSGAGVPTLNRNNVHGEKVTFPTSLDEQKEIVTTLDALSKETQCLAAIYERKLVALEELKKSLLHQAFSGEL